MSKEFEVFAMIFPCKTNRALKHYVFAVSRVLEGLGSSGRLVGSISTPPGTYKSS